ncbi:MAG: WG repeat-containing protein [Rikenellaceae bacterium]|nr:WG repeat-containing protein [Rikenellaceae bacterium]
MLKWEIEPQFDNAFNFSEGLARVKINDKYGYIDQAGREVIAPKYDEARGFSEGLALVIINGKWGYIDKTGRKVIAPKYDDAWVFFEGLAAVKINDEWGYNDKWGYIDKTGQKAIAPKYDDAGYFSEGLTIVKINDKWGYIDKTGREVIAPKYDDAGYFSEGLTIVKINDKWGYIDKTGREVIAPKYDIAGSFSEGLAGVRINDQYGYIDKTGRDVIAPKYDEAWDFHEGLAAVRINGQYGYIDKTGREVISPKYDEAWDFHEGLAGVRINGQYGYIDKTGREVIAPKYDEAWDFHEGLAVVNIDGKWGYVRSLFSPESYISYYVKANLERWEQKDEFETTAEYRTRVTEANRDQRINEWIDYFSDKCVQTAMYKQEVQYAENKGYDADGQTSLINFPTFGDIVVKLPSATDARALKENWDKVTFTSPEFARVVDESGQEHIVLSKLTVVNGANNIRYNWSVYDNYPHSQITVKPQTYEPVSFGSEVTNPNTTTQIIDNGPSDVDVNIPETGRQKPQTFAVIFGNEDYTLSTGDASKNVPYAAADAEIFAHYCEKTLGIPTQNIRLVVNATAGQMQSNIKWLSEKAELENGNAELLLYYSGHGLPGEDAHNDKEPYLVPVDISSNNLDMAVNLGRLYETLGQYPTVKTTVLLDACFSGGAREGSLWADSKGVRLKPKTKQPIGNMVTLTSSSGNERSGVYKEKKHGYFTYFLLKRLQETKGNVTYGDLFDYLYENVRKTSHNEGMQTPDIIPSLVVANVWRSWKFTK